MRFLSPLLFLTALAGPALAEPPLLVEIVTAEQSSPTRDYTLVGIVEAQNSYPASFRSGGLITDIFADVGDHVAAGAEIARLDATTAQAQRDAAQATLEAVAARLKQAEQSRDRVEASLSRGTATQADLDEAVQSFLSAQSSYRQAQTQLDKAQQGLDDTTLHAIEDVIVTERNAEPGEIVGAGASVLELATDGRLDAKFYVPDIGNLNSVIGLPVAITPIDGGETIIAFVAEVSPVVSVAGTVEMTAHLPNDTDLPLGGLVEARVTLDSDPVITLPADALFVTANGPAVWVVDPATMTVSPRAITVASYREAEIAISGGITAGEQIVGAGSQVLYAGREVYTEAQK